MIALRSCIFRGIDGEALFLFGWIDKWSSSASNYPKNRRNCPRHRSKTSCSSLWCSSSFHIASAGGPLSLSGVLSILSWLSIAADAIFTSLTAWFDANSTVLCEIYCVFLLSFLVQQRSYQSLLLFQQSLESFELQRLLRDEIWQR